MITVAIPGKLFIAGEWNCLQTGRSCIVLPVNKFLTVAIKPSEQFVIHAPDITLQPIIIDYKQQSFQTQHNITQGMILPITAFQTTMQFLIQMNHTPQPCSISISSDISKITLPDGQTTKIGFGSSAAVVVGIIKALLLFHNFQTNNLKLLTFKLAAIIHQQAQKGVGSGADCALCAFGHPIFYQKYDGQQLAEQLTKNTIADIVATDWPHLTIKPINIPSGIHIIAGFVGTASSTTSCIAHVKKIMHEQPTLYRICMDAIEESVQKLGRMYEHNQPYIHTKTSDLINNNRLLLRRIVPFLETPELTKLITIANLHGAAAKFSGAGGGDCGIAICCNNRQAENVCKAWNNAGFITFHIAH